ncbi:hypothetical protein PIB30_085706 [Stylosanthes scabra]|uniref:Uncharacterized protein n=1 Tax=Stylosanthes scabra TaxID=79078 RepID=A0ABU6VRD3_9FABA|nr:hypothetical protein [Stylosanthes scabra]
MAPLETIRTHLMVGSSGHSTNGVFHNIMKTDGWKGLFRGNFVNVIRVEPSKAIEDVAVSVRLYHKSGVKPVWIDAVVPESGAGVMGIVSSAGTKAEAIKSNSDQLDRMKDASSGGTGGNAAVAGTELGWGTACSDGVASDGTRLMDQTNQLRLTHVHGLYAV